MTVYVLDAVNLFFSTNLDVLHTLDRHILSQIRLFTFMYPSSGIRRAREHRIGPSSAEVHA